MPISDCDPDLCPSDLKTTSSKAKPPGTKNPDACASGSVVFKTLAVSYSHMAAATLSSALSRFTSVFGMGTGGSNSLWPPGKLADETHFRALHRIRFVVERRRLINAISILNVKMLASYMLKTNEKFVRVRYNHYWYSTS